MTQPDYELQPAYLVAALRWNWSTMSRCHQGLSGFDFFFCRILKLAGTSGQDISTSLHEALRNEKKIDGF